MFPVIALDLDGTLLRSNGSISKRSIRILEGCLEAGIKIVIATARPPRMISKILPELLSALPCICYNGAEIYEAGRRTAVFHLEPEAARQIVTTVNTFSPDSAVSAEIDDWAYCDRVIDNPLLPPPYDVVDLINFIEKPVAKVLFDCSCLEDKEPLAHKFPHSCTCKFTCGGALGEVMSASSSKAAGLALLLEKWSMNLSDVIAFGDDVTDMEMLSKCGLGVAMANAVPEVKSAADRVTISNDEDGVAVVLEEVMGEL